MPRCKGENRDEREYYALVHQKAMQEKYSQLYGTDAYNDCDFWRGSIDNEDYNIEHPLPYDRRFYFQYFVRNIIRVRNTDIVPFLNYEFYADNYDKEYIEGLLADIRETGILQKGFAATLLTNGDIIKYPNDYSWSERDVYRYSQETYFGSEYYADRLEIVRKWLYKSGIPANVHSEQGSNSIVVQAPAAIQIVPTIESFCNGICVDDITALLQYLGVVAGTPAVYHLGDLRGKAKGKLSAAIAAYHALEGAALIQCSVEDWANAIQNEYKIPLGRKVRAYSPEKHHAQKSAAFDKYTESVKNWLFNHSKRNP